MTLKSIHINSEVTMGNLVSWGLILVAFVAGYARLQGTVVQADLVAKEAKLVASQAQTQVYGIKTDIEVIRVTTFNTEKKIDELRSVFNKRLVNNE